VSVLSFVLLSLSPGNAASTILGVNGSQADYAKLNRALGLDLPIYEQYWHWLRPALTGNLGSSLISGEHVAHMIDVRLPVTLSLVVGSLLVSAVVGVAFGIFSAVRGGVIGRAVDALAVVGFALPAFWIAAALIALFSVQENWLPSSGYVSFASSPTGWLRSLALPVLALAIGSITAVAKQTREAMLEELSTEHIRMAWAEGLSVHSILYRHALKNASLQIITILGVLAVQLLAGTVIIENIFALPGLGSLIVTSSLDHDLPVVQGIAVFFTVLIVAINFSIDLLYAALNPKLAR
jgi:peptide/nickel transport system permease protein